MRKKKIRDWYYKLPLGAIIAVKGQVYIKSMNNRFDEFWRHFRFKLGWNCRNLTLIKLEDEQNGTTRSLRIDYQRIF